MLSIIADSRLLFSLRRISRRVLSRVATDCPLCQGAATGGALCAGCHSDITFTMRADQPRCARCAQRWAPRAWVCVNCAELDPAFTRVIAAFDYEPPFDSLMGRYKTDHRFGLSTALARLLADAVEKSTSLPEGALVDERTGLRMSDLSPGERLSRMGESSAAGHRPHAEGLSWGGQARPDGGRGLRPDTILVPIPSSDASLRRRGFNPAGELAASLGGCLQLPVRRGVLRRVREGPRQAFSRREERMQRAVGLFECVAPIVGRPVGLVDDVMTTGSTVNAATHALLRAGAAEVTVLVAARTPIRAVLAQ